MFILTHIVKALFRIRIYGLPFLLLLATCVNSHKEYGYIHTGFITSAYPKSDIKKPIHEVLDTNNAPHATIIIYNHGTTDSFLKEDCTTWHNAVPDVLVSLINQDTYIYYVCSQITDEDSPGAYIERRAKEIENTIDTFITLGVSAKNIFLAGHSAGAWAILTMGSKVKKFNASILFAPACCRPRANKSSNWKFWKNLEKTHMNNFLSMSEIHALIFVFADDHFNRMKELLPLKEKFLNTIKMIEYNCGAGHNTHINNCKESEIKEKIKTYIQMRKIEY